MISKNKLKYIKSLAQKKQRVLEEVFLVEGEKLVREAIAQNWEIVNLFASAKFLALYPDLPIQESKIIEATSEELEQMGQLSSNGMAAALVKMDGFQSSRSWKESLALFLDGINDPGNLGTLIRTANWFGIQHVFCGDHTVDCYNPKVVQASMGALFSTEVRYVQNESFVTEARTLEGYEIVGADLKGMDLRACSPLSKGCLVMGSESHGISSFVQESLTQKVTIKQGALGQMESLNVGVAAGIICHQLSPYL